MPEPLYYIPCPTCEQTTALLETTLSRIVRCLRKDFPQLEEGINLLSSPLTFPLAMSRVSGISGQRGTVGVRFNEIVTRKRTSSAKKI
jgi:hypothetical protein